MSTDQTANLSESAASDRVVHPTCTLANGRLATCAAAASRFAAACRSRGSYLGILDELHVEPRSNAQAWCRLAISVVALLL
jgi:hypothetical protein